MNSEYKQVPPLLVNDNIIYVTIYGDVMYKGRIIRGKRMSKDNYGYYYKTLTINGCNYHFHDLVFYAYSHLTVDELKRGNVEFTNICRIKMKDNVYRNWLSDLYFKPYCVFLVRKRACNSPSPSPHLY